MVSDNLSNFDRYRQAASRGDNGIIRTSTSFADKLLRPRCLVSDDWGNTEDEATAEEEEFGGSSTGAGEGVWWT